MEKYDFQTKAEQYRSEMMKLYGKSGTKEDFSVAETDSSPDTENDVPDDEITVSTDEEDTSGEFPIPYIEEAENVSQSIIDDIDQRFPDPDISSLDSETRLRNNEQNASDSYPTEESIGSSRGFVLVNVRTGRDSGVVEGARVVITALIDGTRVVMASGVTDLSGATPIFELPAPDEIYSQTPSPPVRPYSLFNISVTANGFFNSLSIDVPVFSGITSVQNFNMVPVPLFTEPSSETVIYYNQEPFYDEYASQGG